MASETPAFEELPQAEVVSRAVHELNNITTVLLGLAEDMGSRRQMTPESHAGIAAALNQCVQRGRRLGLVLERLRSELKEHRSGERGAN